MSVIAEAFIRTQQEYSRRTVKICCTAYGYVIALKQPIQTGGNLRLSCVPPTNSPLCQHRNDTDEMHIVPIATIILEFLAPMV